MFMVSPDIEINLNSILIKLVFCHSLAYEYVYCKPWLFTLTANVEYFVSPSTVNLFHIDELNS